MDTITHNKLLELNNLVDEHKEWERIREVCREITERLWGNMKEKSDL